ncbi:MAG: beta-hydroxyacyl-ACP dehydratase, partial [Eubacteriales bacterium]|nr:beta-hydroxyacyl-ACP dehydratase [Eubacteriales bacterium]
MGEAQLNRAQIMEIIPHRDPMLLVDSVLSMTEGTCIEGSFYVDPDREIFKGHFPDEPVLPGV